MKKLKGIGHSDWSHLFAKMHTCPGHILHIVRSTDWLSKPFLCTDAVNVLGEASVTKQIQVTVTLTLAFELHHKSTCPAIFPILLDLQIQNSHLDVAMSGERDVSCTQFRSCSHTAVWWQKTVSPIFPKNEFSTWNILKLDYFLSCKVLGAKTYYLRVFQEWQKTVSPYLNWNLMAKNRIYVYLMAENRKSIKIRFSAINQQIWYGFLPSIHALRGGAAACWLSA